MTITELFKTRLSPFRRKDFRLFFSAQMMSLIGNWMQELAKSWIVLNLLGKASAMGALLFAQAVPNLVLGFFGGTIADRRDIKQILIVTQIALSTSAFALGVVVSTGQIQFWHLLVFAVLEGVIIAFDYPAFTKITPRLVGREDFQQALALNTVNFHLSRVIGPSVAGIVMGIWGPASVFWANAVSFLGVVLVVLRLNLQGQEPKTRESAHGGMKEAIAYLRNSGILSRIIIQLFLIMGLLFPLMFTTFRIYLTQRFALTPRQFGFVFACPGAGALAGSLTFLLLCPKEPLKALPIGLTGVVLFLVAVAEAPTLPLAIAALVAFSFFMFLTMSSLNVTLQLRLENRFRGRIAAVVGMAFISLGPIMSVPIGVFSDSFGPRLLMWGLAVMLALASTGIHLKFKGVS